VVAPDTVPGGLRLAVHPEWLPGDRAILFAGARGLGNESAEILALELASGTRTSLLTNAADPLYLETGHLLFMRQGTLMAVAFDPVALEVLGEPVPVMEGVQQALEMPNAGYTTGVGQVAVSRDGHLAYASGGLYPGTLYTPRRVALDGSWEPMGLEARRYTRFRVSPEGRRLAYEVSSAEGGDLFVSDLDRGVARQLDTGFSNNAYPAWSPDGRYLAFSAEDEPGTPNRNLYRMAVDGTGRPERLAPSDSRQIVADWSSAGVLAFLEEGDIWVIPPDGEPEPFVTSDGVAAYASFSPDGQWLAYTLADGGPSAVYVRPYPGPGAATLVSAAGASPAWSPDGGTLYFTTSANDSPRRLMMMARIDVGSELSVGRATPMIDPWPYPIWSGSRGYDVLADGSFIAPWREIDAEVPEGARTNPLRIANRVEEINVVLGWFDELRERVPVD
jgi:serine/threonine-protein kinase